MFRSHGPSRADAPEGFLFSGASARSTEFSGSAGTGDPDPGARARFRARPEARGLSEGTRRKPDTDDGANQSGFAMAVREDRERRDRICFFNTSVMARTRYRAPGDDDQRNLELNIKHCFAAHRARLCVPGGEEDRLLRPTKGAPASQFPWKCFGPQLCGVDFRW